MRIPKAGIKTIDRASLATLIITLFLFSISLAEKGLTQEILLEAGVFLVSIKLVLATHKIDLRIKSVDDKLSRLAGQGDSLKDRRVA